jgi:hypothetical protein
MEIEMLKLIGNALNMSLDIAKFGGVDSFLGAGNRNSVEELKGQPFIFVGWPPGVNPAFDSFCEYTRSYLTVRLVWYTPCAVKYERLGRFFKIFSVDMWIFFALSLILAVITVRCISNYSHKSHFYESNSYSNIFSVTTNITAVSLSVPVNTQPRSAPLRLFFFCWVCYSVAISTVFQAYLTTFLIEPGYEEPIKSLEQMLTSDLKFGYIEEYGVYLDNLPDSLKSDVINNAVRCPDIGASFNWAAVYQNASMIFDTLNVEICRDMGKLTDENNRPLLCELEDGGVTSAERVLLVSRGSPFLDLINNIIDLTVESGILTHINKKYLLKEGILSMSNAFAFDDTYIVFGVRHLQTAFYLLIAGYVLAFACFVTEIVGKNYRSKV